MSAYPVVGVECPGCDARCLASDFGLDVARTDAEQWEFTVLLRRAGWSTRGLPELEASDDGLWSAACPKCNFSEALLDEERCYQQKIAERQQQYAQDLYDLRIDYERELDEIYERAGRNAPTEPG
ncbi:MAG: hypothetical protein EHM35_15865 [Planctomycetaceae bacterium]|nr:MAG: hypothetical protein EHM35_15865 [Planctomycetaceae bacterium]